MNKFSYYPTYYAAFDPGSGRAGMFIASDETPTLSQDSLTIDSCIAIGNADTLLARGDIDATIQDVVRDGETLITLQGVDYFLEDLIKEGRNTSYQLANPDRYNNDHAKVLLLALASQLIPHRAFTLRVVTALPVTLYNRENRAKMKQSLSGYYRYQYNGREREAIVSVGYVAMEGQGVLISSGLSSAEQSVIDIGERTTDFVAADGQKLLVSQCDGNQELGVGMITDAVDTLFKRYGRVLSIPKIHKIMAVWAAGNRGSDLNTPNGTLAWSEVERTIEKARTALAKGIVSFASGTWNVEGESVGQRFAQITVAGGGAHYVDDLISGMLPRVIIPECPEDANIRGYLDLALSLEDKIENVWVA